MKRLLIVILFAGMTACAQRAQPCDLEVTHTIAFSAPGAEDQLSVQSIGPTCERTIGLFTLRTSDGFPIWSWSAPLSHRFGDVFAPEDREQMQAFLESWAQPALTSTHHAPTFETLAPADTSLDQLTYEDIRARDLPMLCHYSGTGRQTCVFWEPAAGGAGHFMDRTVAETGD
jgi:hypothetical protein